MSKTGRNSTCGRVCWETIIELFLSYSQEIERFNSIIKIFVCTLWESESSLSSQSVRLALPEVCRKSLQPEGLKWILVTTTRIFMRSTWFLGRCMLMEYFSGLWLLFWWTTAKAVLTDATFIHKFRQVSHKLRKC